nr:hypothetical protein B0A51_06542 [Rachicladosporium sp. CCFEE 5018]
MKARAPETDGVLEAFTARQAVGSAAQQRLLESKFGDAPALASYDAAEDNETKIFLASLGDVTGLHSAKDVHDPDLPEGLMSGKPVNTDDQLLERLLGKRDAGEHKKRQAKAKSEKGAAESAAPVANPVVKRKAEVVAEESEDEEQGRGSSFRMKKLARSVVKPDVTEIEAEVELPSAVVMGAEEATPAPGKQVREIAKPRKAQPASYLDELLAKKGKKKGKVSDNG